METVTLAILRRAAEALDCELRDALVPRRSLVDTLETRAGAVARKRIATVIHTMALKAHGSSPDAVEAQTRALADCLLKGPRRALWQEE